MHSPSSPQPASDIPIVLIKIFRWFTIVCSQIAHKNDVASGSAHRHRPGFFVGANVGCVGELVGKALGLAEGDAVGETTGCKGAIMRNFHDTSCPYDPLETVSKTAPP